jgi:hypothetical protein
MSVLWGFCWTTLDEPMGLNSPMLRRTCASMDQNSQQMVLLSGPESLVRMMKERNEVASI